MKKLLLPFLCCLFFQSKATIWAVSVQNFQFSPATLNVNVGDTVRWNWISGTHTTTALTVPAGAVLWDAPVSTTSKKFDYIVTAAGSYSYQCDIHPSLMQGSFTASSVTPVTLSAFNVSGNSAKIDLTWTTETESNADHFSIRKSLDGIHFDEIATVPAAGNSSVRKDYSFTDIFISSSTRYVYYALATVDKDGKTQLSPIRIYKNKAASAKLIISISPNPIGDMGHLMLQFNADKASTMIARLIDAQGRLVLQTELSTVQGVNNGHIHVGGISKGFYTLQFSLDGVTESRQVIKN
ncbi:MAG: T9SS type A sorting domain-containing protein [Bacteroidota bacterium]|nr:T9SS type A sorting domain-containing protein [Bacteroidota bacterium]